MNHFIFDYETIGQDPTKCVLVNCAYFIFDSDRFVSNNPYTHKELTSSIKFDKVNIEAQKKAGFLVEKESLAWWMKQEPEIRNQLLPTDQDVTRATHANNLMSYIFGKKIDRWWSRGNTFDPVILKTIDDAYQTGLFDILRFWNVRDVRTFIDTKFGFSTRTDFCPFTDEKKWKEVFKKHNSIHDVSADILRLQTIARAEQDLEIINE